MTVGRKRVQRGLFVSERSPDEICDGLRPVGGVQQSAFVRHFDALVTFAVAPFIAKKFLVVR